MGLQSLHHEHPIASVTVLARLLPKPDVWVVLQYRKCTDTPKEWDRPV
jgi:hypothetical protein